MAKGRILFIDDSEVILARVAAVLSANGYEVKTTTRTVGNAGLVLTCDLVIVDYHMPGFDGVEVMRGLRAALPPGHPCLFYVYTSDPDVAAAYGRLGFDGALTGKGDEMSLLAQMDMAFRRLSMRKLKQQRSGGA
jgi:DNA-binding NarL/FixJ family response regulator